MWWRRCPPTAEGDGRIEIGGGHADAGGLGGELALGLAHVGPPAQQGRAVAHRQGSG